MSPNRIDDAIIAKGQNREYESSILGYLSDQGYSYTKLTSGYGARKPTDGDLANMRETIKSNGVVLYHFKGHYAVMWGYQKTGEGENDYQYFFDDPAGDRTEGYFNDSGEKAAYSQDYLKTQDIYDSWGIYEGIIGTNVSVNDVAGVASANSSGGSIVSIIFKGIFDDMIKL
jgi:hypothetical protein